MPDFVVGLFFLCFGFVFVRFNRSLAIKAVRERERLFGVTYRQTPFRILFATIGACFMLFGLLVLLDVIDPTRKSQPQSQPTQREDP